MLRSLRYRRQPRLHWHAEADPRKTKIAESIGALALPATVVVGMPLAKRKQERARAKCMEALLPELEAQGVTQVWLEARTSSLIRRDMCLVDALRSQRLITPAIRVDTALPGDEPMLWLPDAVAGAVSASRDGESEYLALIGPVQHIEISTLQAECSGPRQRGSRVPSFRRGSRLHFPTVNGGGLESKFARRVNIGQLRGRRVVAR
jgi:hypothetical protein